MPVVLTPTELAAARRWASRPASHDTSSDGRFEARPDGDAVEIVDTRDGSVRQWATPSFQPREVTVSDDGHTVAFTASPSRDHVELAIMRDGGPPQVMPLNSLSLRSPDFSPDGRRLAAAHTTDVVTIDSKGEHALAHLPNWVERVEYMPSGRLMAQCTWYGWGSSKVPVYWVIDAAGHSQPIKDPKLADWLGQPVLKPLLESLESAYPKSTPAQQQALLERFGYDGPTFRLRAPDESHMIFRLDGAFDVPSAHAGTWLLRTDGSDADAVQLAAADDTRLGGRKFSEAVWSDASQRAAAIFTGGSSQEALIGVTDRDGRFELLPLPLDRRGEVPCAWGPDERWLVWQVPDGERTSLFCHDTKSGQWYPLAADARLEGWNGDMVRVRRRNDRIDEIPPLPLQGDKAVGIVLGTAGSGAGHAPAGAVKVTDDQVIVNGIKIPRRHGLK